MLLYMAARAYPFEICSPIITEAAAHSAPPLMVCVAGGDHDFAVSVVEVVEWSRLVTSHPPASLSSCINQQLPLAPSTSPQMYFLAPLLPIRSGADFAPIAQRPCAARLRLPLYRRPLDWLRGPLEWGVSLEHRIAA